MRYEINNRFGRTRIALPHGYYGLPLYGARAGNLRWSTIQYNRFGQPMFDPSGRQINPFNPGGGFHFNLTWPAPFVFTQDGGTVAGSYNPAAFDLLCHADFGGQPLTCSGTTNNTSNDQIYTGPATDCNLHVVFASAVINDPGGAFTTLVASAEIDQDGTRLALINFAGVDGTFDIPFTIINSVNSHISVTVTCEADCNAILNGDRHIHMTGTLTPS